MSDLKTTLTKNMVITATEFGIAVVQEIAVEVLKQKPEISLRDFVLVLEQQKAKITEVIDVKSSIGPS